jgi:glycosyltransferase involved in cell wall biosynthesis
MKIFLNNINESWVVDRFRDDWYKHNSEISTNSIKKADIVWIISPWIWKNVKTKFLRDKKVVCSIYHIDFDKFTEKDKEEFYIRDEFVDIYHVISNKTISQLRKLTDKKIISIPFWVDQNIFYEIQNTKDIRQKFNFNDDDYLIGSFQRDTEGSDLVTPKLIKGPDIFLEIVTDLFTKNKNMKVVLAGKRRNYLIENLKKREIPFKYFEMVTSSDLNELYNILDLYLVTSRLEGGPQAILECGISKTPILSTDVGVAPEILNKKSIFNIEEFNKAKVDVEYAYKNSLNFTIPDGMESYIRMFKDLYEG